MPIEPLPSSPPAGKLSRAWSVYRGSDENHLEMVRPVLSFFNVVEVKGDYLFPRHQHFNYQLIFAVRGSYRCMLNDRPLTLRPRDILIVKPGDWHEDYGRKGDCYHAANFDLAGTSRMPSVDIVFASGTTPLQQVLRGPNREIHAIVERMLAAAAAKGPFVSYMENALLLELFWQMIRTLPRTRLSPVLQRGSEEKVFGDRMFRLFEAHLEKQLDITVMADLMGMSVRTLTKRCRKIIGESPMKAFMGHKMNHAAKLLQLSDLAVKDISFQMGFQNQYHFSRVFRRHWGRPPSALRAVPKQIS
jgi:AraC-like DNA-binding protein